MVPFVEGIGKGEYEIDRAQLVVDVAFHQFLRNDADRGRKQNMKKRRFDVFHQRPVNRQLHGQNEQADRNDHLDAAVPKRDAGEDDGQRIEGAGGQ
ncbi:hypothetical protein [Paenibacillus humicola]|uniref:hypothetical protein n=1 Tax=Paenibacillus humicola TaxID=3110540 RepID=UPI00237B506E|nr:hypothetical protein [Paenibacillus humicola]